MVDSCCVAAEEEATAEASQELAPNRQARQREYVRIEPTPPPSDSPPMREIIQMGLLGVGALAALAGLFMVIRKLASSELPKVQKVRATGQDQQGRGLNYVARHVAVMGMGILATVHLCS